ncbi:MAG: MFS transporter [Alphaproteobacteria bacterium]
MANEDLKQHTAFRALWVSDTISTAGSVVTQIALPFIAISLLDAAAFEMGLLAAAGQAPRILFSLYIGASIATRPKLPLMRAAQLLRALSLLSIPLAYWGEALTMLHLLVVALVNGTLGLIFLYADRALLPKLVGRNLVLAANARLRLTATMAQTAGPSLAGAVLQVIAAPLIIMLDALSYLLSWVWLGKIDHEEEGAAETGRESPIETLKRGATFVWSEKTLRALTLSSLFATAGASAYAALFMLFLLRDLSFTPLRVGVVLSAAGLAAVVSAAMVERVSKRLGARWAIILSTTIPILGYVAIGLAPSTFIALGMVVAGQLLIGLATPLYQVNEMTQRQLLAPAGLLPMVSAFRTFLAGGIAPIAALCAGVLGEVLGVRETLYIATAIFALGLIPLRRLP